jgi:hypothetical protein
VLVFDEVCAARPPTRGHPLHPAQRTHTAGGVRERARKAFKRWRAEGRARAVGLARAARTHPAVRREPCAASRSGVLACWRAGVLAVALLDP